MMAEALGVVASGIAVAQAAGALGKLAMSMRTLWRDVGDVPTIIDHTLQQLEMTAKFIEEVEATATTSGSVKVGLNLAIKSCSQVHQEMESFVAGLSRDITSSRKTKRAVAKTRVVLNKETLDGFVGRLQQALQFLNTALLLDIS
jgi:hypothetical protein